MALPTTTSPKCQCAAEWCELVYDFCCFRCVTHLRALRACNRDSFAVQFFCFFWKALLFSDVWEFVSYLFKTFEAQSSNSKWNKNDIAIMMCKQVTKGLWLATSYIAPSNNKNKWNGTNLSNATSQSISNTMKDQFAVKQTWIDSQKQIHQM